MRILFLTVFYFFVFITFPYTLGFSYINLDVKEKSNFKYMSTQTCYTVESIQYEEPERVFCFRQLNVKIPTNTNTTNVTVDPKVCLSESFFMSIFNERLFVLY